MTGENLREALGRAPLSTSDLERLAKHFHASLTNEARTYLHSRGIQDDAIQEYGIGYDSGLSQLGSALRYCVVFPIRDIDGTVRDLAGRLINEEDAGRLGVWRNLVQPPEAMFNEPAIAVSDEVFVCEGPLDALALIQAGYPAVGVLDIARFSERFIDLLKDKRVFICYDNDDDGRRQRTRTAADLSAAGVQAVYTVTIPEDYKDVSELFTEAPQRGEDPKRIFREAVDNAIDEGTYSQFPADIKSSNAFYHEFLRRNRGQHRPPSTGLKSLDGLLLGGLWEGLYVIAGPPGTGKTALVRQLSAEIARQSIPVLFISLETGAYELWAASIARESGIAFADVFSGTADRDAVRSANQVFRSFSGFLWTIEVGSESSIPNRTLDELVRAVSRDVGKSPVVLIDHFQDGADQGLRIGDSKGQGCTSLDLKRLSRDAGIPVVLTHSLPEPASVGCGSEATGEVPQAGLTCDVLIEMSLLKGSLERKDIERLGTASEVERVQVRVMKNRGSSPAVITLTFDRATGSFGQ